MCIGLYWNICCMYVDCFCSAFTWAVKLFHFDTEWNQQTGIACSTTTDGYRQSVH